MKSKFLDIRNCHQLLPKGNGLSLIARLDVCLNGLNSQHGTLYGSIDALIKQNEKTHNLKVGSKRLVSSPIEIAQNLIIEKRVIHTQAVTRNFPGPALFHTHLGYENGMEHQTIIPLQYLLKGWGDASKDYQCYVHTISTNINSIKDFNDLFRRNMTDADSYYYVGITGRNWLLRLEEHINEMRKGNRRLFYKVWREMYGANEVLFTSFLKDINLSFEEAMYWEEQNVDKIASDKYGLNMIPGGFKGLKFLHKYRIIDNTDITLEERELAISKFAVMNPRKGIPNPFIADLWKDDDFYLRIIEAKEKTLSELQVRKVRELHQLGKTIPEITQEVNALNDLQVKNVIIGKTYKRIK